MDDRGEFDKAETRAQERSASTPRAESARYDGAGNRIVIRLSSRLEVSFAPQDAGGLEGALAAQLGEIEISPSGFGIHFPQLDADIYLPALLEGFLGSRKWMASRMGSAGGRTRTKSVAKSAAAKKNGRLGGRPRKKTVALAS